MSTVSFTGCMSGRVRCRLAHDSSLDANGKKAASGCFKTFLRTFLHELGHHLDYELWGLGDSLHTEGFYHRENILFKQLMGYPASD